MKIVMIARNDPAGTAFRLCDAINRGGVHTARLITWERRYNCQYAEDIHLRGDERGPIVPSSDIEEFERMLDSADVFHFHMCTDERDGISSCGGWFPWSLYTEGKIVVHHHHGEQPLRANISEWSDRYSIDRPADPVIVSTPDMVDLFRPGRAEWLPNIAPKFSPPRALESWMRRLEGSMLSVCHSPTKRALKSTSDLEEAVERLRRRGVKIDLDIVENATHAETLRRKWEADIVFDQMNYSFGVSSLEALAMGRPAMVWLDRVQQERIAEWAGCPVKELPFMVPPENSSRGIENALGLLADSKATPKGKAWLYSQSIFSRAWIDRWWSDAKIVAQLLKIYESRRVERVVAEPIGTEMPS